MWSISGRLSAPSGLSGNGRVPAASGEAGRVVDGTEVPRRVVVDAPDARPEPSSEHAPSSPPAAPAANAAPDRRVALRRLRSDLDTFRPMVDRDEARPLRRELRWLGQQLGGVRDSQVTMARLAGEIGERTKDQAIRAELLEPLSHRHDI